MKRRQFITLLGGAVAWPCAARAQQDGRMRRVGVLMLLAQDDLEGKARLAGFRQGLERLGWFEGRNLRIDYRHASANEEQRQAAKELMALQPEVIFAPSPNGIEAVLQESRTVPIVYAGITDPINAGYAASLARPGGNLTGFMLYEPSIAGKWLALLKEIAPRTSRVAALVGARNTFAPSLPSAQVMAASLSIELVSAYAETAADIEREIESIASQPNSGLVVPPSANVVHRDLVVALAARYRLPAVYYARFWVAAGGLMSYGTDYVDQYRQAASYVDRILRGAKPADLPVQVPVKYETVLNLKTAKALGLTVPDLLLVRADEVIE
jgi:putative ABC transport system substrate-binding protein